jgi:flagellar basal body rod protein FlgG
MKMEFKQKQTELLSLGGLKTGQFLAIAIETSKQLGWVLGNENEMGFIAYTRNGFFAWNAEIKIKVISGMATLQSQSLSNEFSDVRGNKMNIEVFISTFKSIKSKLLLLEPELKYIISKSKIA